MACCRAQERRKWRAQARAQWSAHAPSAVPAQGSTQGVSAGEVEEGAPGGALGVNIEQQMRGPVFERWRSKFYDVPGYWALPEPVGKIARVSCSAATGPAFRSHWFLRMSADGMRRIVVG